MDFQVILAEAMYNLSVAHTDASRMERELIARKPRLSKSWMAGRMRALAERKTVLERAVGIGKSFGDAFAWFFYQNDRALLDEHLQQPATSMISAGVGGRAEVSFIRGVRMINRRLVIYHGTTSLLRLGDISLVELNPLRVLGIAELKAGALRGGRVQVVASFIGSRTRLTPEDLLAINDAPPAVEEGSDAPESETLPTETLSPAAQARFDRQLKRTRDAIAAAGKSRDEGRLVSSASSYTGALNDLVGRARQRGFTYGRLAPSLGAVVYRPPRAGLHARLTAGSGPLVGELPSTLGEDMTKLLIPGSPHNHLITGGIHYAANQPALLRGTVPLFWWDMASDVIRQILMGEITVMTLFNPAYLLHRIEAEGFAVTRFNPPDGFGVEREFEGGAKMSVENFSYFARLIPAVMFSEDQVVELFRYFVNHPRLQEIGPGARVEMIISQNLWPPPGDPDGADDDQEGDASHPEERELQPPGSSWSATPT